MNSHELFGLYIRYPKNLVEKNLRVTKFVKWMECVRSEVETMCNEVIDAIITDIDKTMSITKLSDLVVERCKLYEDWDANYEQATLMGVVSEFYSDCGLRQYWQSCDDVCINYEMQELLVNWLGYVLADQCNKNSLCESWDFFIKSKDVNLLGFVMNRSMSVDALRKIVYSLDVNPVNIVRKLIGASNNATIEKEQNVQDVFNNIKGYAYELSSYRSIDKYWPLINQLIEKKMYGEMIQLLLKFEYPITIYYLLETLRSTQEIESMVRAIRDGEPLAEQKRILTLILINVWWHNLIEEVKRISLIKQDKQSDIFAYINNWEKGLSRKINRFLQVSISILGEKMITHWISKLSLVEQSNESIEIKAINRCVIAIKRQQGKHIPNISAGCEYDFSYLMFKASNRQKDKNHTSLLCEIILNAIKDGKIEWNGAINKKTIRDWAIIADIMYETDNNMWKTLMENVTSEYEGYCIPDISKQFKRAAIESYCMGIILLSIPHYNKLNQRLILNKVFDHIMAQCYYCQRDYIIENYYYAVLVTIELICDQCISNIKDATEKKMINSQLSISLLLKILASANKKLNTCNKTLLQKRLSSEWGVYKQMLSQKKMNNEIQLLESIIKRKV